jgi:cation diffusion facilitator family transporter
MAKNITDVFIGLFNLDKGEKRKKYGYFEGGLSITINLLLFAVKFLLGSLFGSVALSTDALHSLSDVITSVVVIFGFSVAAKPADQKHPFGHGRAERVATIIIACLLIVVGFEFFLNGLERFRNPVPVETNWFIILILCLTIVLKEFLTYVSSNLGKRIDSSVLKADAWHHRSDALSTVLVVIGFILYRFGLYYADGIIAMIISVYIAYMGISLIKESGSHLMGEAPSQSLVDDIKAIALECGGIKDVHHIHVHDYGRRLEITIHIRLKPDTLLIDAHRKASEVEARIKAAIKGAEVTVQTEPDIDSTA